MLKPDKSLGLCGPLDHPDMLRLKLCIDSILKRCSFGAMIVSKGGIGKTRSIRQIIENSGLIEGKDWIHVAANITDTELYKILYDNNDKIIFFDDIGTASKSQAGITILKQATETKDGNNRIISWTSPTYILKDYPTSFAFTGYLIMCLNIRPNVRNGDIEALTSRFLSCIIDISNKTILEMIYSLKYSLSEDANPEEFEMIFDYVCEIGNEESDINIRVFKNAIIWHKLNDNWKKFVEEDLGFDNDTKTVIEIITDGYKGKQATEIWRTRTGKKKSSFYSLLEKIKKHNLI